MKRCLRLHAKGPYPHTDLHLDVVVDADRLVSRIPYCGWWGTLRTTDVLPIILQSDGKVDFGSDPEDDQDERFGSCNLHTVPIRTGVEFQFSNGERIDAMTITSITDLAG